MNIFDLPCEISFSWKFIMLLRQLQINAICICEMWCCSWSQRHYMYGNAKHLDNLSKLSVWCAAHVCWNSGLQITKQTKQRTQFDAGQSWLNPWVNQWPHSIGNLCTCSWIVSIMLSYNVSMIYKYLCIVCACAACMYVCVQIALWMYICPESTHITIYEYM